MRILLALCALLSSAAYAQTTPLAFTCPTAIAEGTKWHSACPAATFQAINPAAKVSSGPSATPTWRTYSLLAGTDTVRVCAPGNVSADKKTCSSAQWVAKSTLTTMPGAGPLGTTALFWPHPTHNTDQTPLMNLAGFKVYKSTTAGELVKGADVPTFAALADVEPNLGPDGLQVYGPIDLAVGTHWFSVATYACTPLPCANEAAKNLSTLSPVVSKIIDAASPVTVSLSCTPNDSIESVVPNCSWGSSNATSCLASGDWTGGKALSGAETLPKITKSATYAMTCTGAGGTATVSASVNLSPRPNPPPTLDAR